MALKWFSRWIIWCSLAKTAFVDSGEFVLLLSNPVKWPLFLPTQVVTPALAQRLKFQRLSDLCQSHQTQVLGHFLFQFLGPWSAWKCWLLGRGQEKPECVPKLWQWAWHQEGQLVGMGDNRLSGHTLLTEMIGDSLWVSMDIAGLTLSSESHSGFGKSRHWSVVTKYSRTGKWLGNHLWLISVQFLSLQIKNRPQEAQGPLLAFLVTLESSFLLLPLPFVFFPFFLTSYSLKGKHSELRPETEAHFVSSEALYSRGWCVRCGGVGVWWGRVGWVHSYCWIPISRPWTNPGKLGVCSPCFLSLFGDSASG